MKILLTALLFSLPAIAQMNPSDIKKVTTLLEDPTKLTNDLCAPEGEKKEEPWCQDLEKSICAVKKTATKQVGDYDLELKTKYVTSLPSTATDVQIARAQMKAIAAAEKETADRTKITAEDQTKLIADVKASMIQQIKSSGFPKQREDYMVKTVSGIVLNDAKTYVDKVIKTVTKDNPRSTKEDIEAVSVESYTDPCGEQGMEANAFYDATYNVFVLCPGLTQSASEYGRTKEEILTALTFTIGHEIGHSIDSKKYADRLAVNKIAYAKMGECYVAETPGLSWEDQRGEIIGDYWGTRVMAERLKTEGRVGEQAFYANVMAMDTLCGGAGDTEHPAGDFRMNKILSRDPQNRTQLECAPPTPEKPFCSLTGAQPPKPAPAKP